MKEKKAKISATMKGKKLKGLTDAKLKFKNDESTLLKVVLEPPKSAGTYSLNGQLFIHLNEKPSAAHRFFMKLLLGFIWADA